MELFEKVNKLENSDSKVDNILFDLIKGKLVWFDPGCGYHIPGSIVEENRTNKSLLIESNYLGKVNKILIKNNFDLSFNLTILIVCF